MNADDIDQLRQLAKWHEGQARYLLLTVTSGQHDGGRFHNAAAARLLRLASQIEKKAYKVGMALLVYLCALLIVAWATTAEAGGHCKLYQVGSERLQVCDY